MATPDPKLAGQKLPIPGPEGVPGEAAGGAGVGGPTGSPMATPQPMEGLQKGARIAVLTARRALQRELPNFEIDSPEFDAVSKALATLGKVFGKTEEDDTRAFPSEVMNMMSAVGPGAMSPGAKAIAGAPPAGAAGAPPMPGGGPQLQPA